MRTPSAGCGASWNRRRCPRGDSERPWCVHRGGPRGGFDPGGGGVFRGVARVEDSIREGVVGAPSIWWGKFAADGANANQTTSQRETDLGHGPVFYDNLVEVSLAD